MISLLLRLAILYCLYCHIHIRGKLVALVHRNLDEIKDATHAFILPAVYRVLKKTKKWIDFNFTYDNIFCADIVPEGIKKCYLKVNKISSLVGSTEVRLQYLILT